MDQQASIYELQQYSITRTESMTCPNLIDDKSTPDQQDEAENRLL